MRVLFATLILVFFSSIAYGLPPGAENWGVECSAGNARSCFFLGIQNLNGDETPQDSLKAVSYAQKSCNLGLSDACFLAGDLYYKGHNNVDQDLEQAVPFFQAACKANFHSKYSCYYAAKAMIGSGANISAALDIANNGCVNGDRYSCTLAARTFLFGEHGISKDAAKAHPYAVKACELEDGWGCYVAGSQLMGVSSGMERNGPLALQLLDRACDLDSLEACHNAGIEVSSGNDLGNDYEKASVYFAKACNGGLDGSCYSAGHLKLILGKYDEALPFLTKICDEQQMGEACRMAGISAVQVNGYSASRTWHQKACELGDQPSCDYVKELNRYESELAEIEIQKARYEKKNKEAADRVTEKLSQGDYNEAMRIATYDYGSREQVSRIVLAAESAGATTNIDPFYYSFLEQWLAIDYQQANAIVRRERLKQPTGTTVSIGNNNAPVFASGPNVPSSLWDQTQKMLDDTYKRNLDAYNRGANPAGFYLRRN